MKKNSSAVRVEVSGFRPVFRTREQIRVAERQRFVAHEFGSTRRSGKSYGRRDRSQYQQSSTSAVGSESKPERGNGMEPGRERVTTVALYTTRSSCYWEFSRPDYLSPPDTPSRPRETRVPVGEKNKQLVTARRLINGCAARTEVARRGTIITIVLSR
uniref:Uncharacterized protein n=1 Tax=Sipha flava TaxID=143950 RepID=A0A2S2QM82_9HEMI